MALIHALIDSLPADEACVWEDEADIDLNPRIGADWTLPGEQRTVMTPGKNVKRYFAAAMDAHTDRLVWVKGKKKNSRLFIDLLKRLSKQYADRKVIHVILVNYSVHSSRQTRTWLAEHGGKFRLHFLPPYSPDDNRIERKLWREVHANVTTNHPLHHHRVAVGGGGLVPHDAQPRRSRTMCSRFAASYIGGRRLRRTLCFLVLVGNSGGRGASWPTVVAGAAHFLMAGLPALVHGDDLRAKLPPRATG